MSGEIPSTDGVQGFQSILPQTVGLEELWPQLQRVRTYPEQVRAYLHALKNGTPAAADYGDLAHEAHEEWPVLEDALTSETLTQENPGAEPLAGILSPLSYPAAGKRNLQTAIDVHSNSEKLLPSHRDLDGRLIVAQTSLAELTAAAAAVDEPGFTPATVPKLGGVDPLGLRQINFDLMDQVFPGLNNVARHIRPFVLVAWAWRRANQLAQGQGIDKIPR